MSTKANPLILKKLLHDQIKIISRRNLVQGKSFLKMLDTGYMPLKQHISARLYMRLKTTSQNNYSQ